MPRKIVTFLIATFFSLFPVWGHQALAGEAEEKEKEKVEPPLEFVLEVDGKSQPLELGKIFSIKGVSEKSALKLTLKPDRYFEKAGVRFRYPKEYTFEADLEDPAEPNWTLSGNDNKIMLFKSKALADHATERKNFENELLEGFGSKNVKISKASIALQGRELSGTRFDIDYQGTHIRQDYFSFAHGDFNFILGIQDCPKENGQTTAGTAMATKLLAESFQFSEKKE